MPNKQPHDVNLLRIQDQIERLLISVRKHLKMEAGFVSQFERGKRVFKYVQCDPSLPIEAGTSNPLADSYCKYVVEGKIPAVLTDAARHPFAAHLPATRELPVGAHISVPIRLKDGSIYGTFCCFSRKPNPKLGPAQLEIMQVCVDVISNLIDDDLHRREAMHRIDEVLSVRSLSMVYQPIYRLADNKLMNFEALARFPAQPIRPPDIWFNEAAMVGLGPALELLAVQEALKALLTLPAQTSLSINLSPDALLSADCATLFDEFPCDRLIIELTEHAPVTDYEAIRTRLAVPRDNGLRLAIDDVGAGHSSFKHILELKPDLIKLDISLTRNIDTDTARQTAAEAVAMFGRRMGCEVVAEGVETIQELTVLRAIGATKVQGYLLGRPLLLKDACRLPSTFDIEHETALYMRA